MCAEFWIDVHPQGTKEDGFVTRFAKLAGLDGGLGGLDSEGTLIAPIRNVLITGDTAVGQFSLANYDEALELEKKEPDVRRQRAEQGALTIDVFQQALAATNPKFLHHLVEDLDEAHREFVAFITFLRHKETEVVAAGGQGFVPPSSTIENLLDKSLGTLKGLTSQMLPAQQATGSTGTSEGRAAEGAPVGDRANERLLSSSIKSRQEAFQVLGRVSEFFRVTEPHSPISYALEQVVRWGRMSLPELLSELVTDKSSRSEIFKRTGITEKASDE